MQTINTFHHLTKKFQLLLKNGKGGVFLLKFIKFVSALSKKLLINDVTNKNKHKNILIKQK